MFKTRKIHYEHVLVSKDKAKKFFQILTKLTSRKNFRIRYLPDNEEIGEEGLVRFSIIANSGRNNPFRKLIDRGLVDIV